MNYGYNEKYLCILLSTNKGTLRGQKDLMR